MAIDHSILIVEDDPFLARLYQAKFQADNFTVYTAGDGEQGLKLARELKPDILLLDVSLPKLDGFSVLKALRSEAATKTIPVVMLTNYSDPQGIELAKTLAANAYLIKAQFLPSEVVAKVRSLISSA